MDVWTVPCAEFVGAVRHHRHFTENEAARRRLASFCERIERAGMKAFVDEEYPAGSGKAFIVNQVDGRLFLADGNAHMVSLVRCFPDLTLKRLEIETQRRDLVRFWVAGWEAGSNQEKPYDVFVPMQADVSRIPGAYTTEDSFKDPPEPTKAIPAAVPFDSPLLSVEDRGCPLEETVRFLGF